MAGKGRGIGVTHIVYRGFAEKSRPAGQTYVAGL